MALQNVMRGVEGMPGIILIGMALMLGFITGVFRRVPNPKSVAGEIVSLEREKTMSSEQTTYAAYVEYCVNGMLYTTKSRYTSATFHVGDKLRVVYNKANPQQAIIRPRVTIYFAMIGFVAAGIIVCCRTLF